MTSAQSALTADLRSWRAPRKARQRRLRAAACCKRRVHRLRIRGKPVLLHHGRRAVPAGPAVIGRSARVQQVSDLSSTRPQLFWQLQQAGGHAGRRGLRAAVQAAVVRVAAVGRLRRYELSNVAFRWCVRAVAERAASRFFWARHISSER